jgi:23S rRNA pseudouridine2605 synthase
MTRHGLARVLSKLGLCSRSQAERWIVTGRVAVNDRIAVDPQQPTRIGVDRILVDGRDVHAAAPVYIMLNKPRGLVTSTSDERGRDTVYRCFDGADLPWMAPVGRLDRASEGLLLFSNDPQWAARITDPATGPPKTYHVQVGDVPDVSLPTLLTQGVVDRGERLRAASAHLLRHGQKNAWLEIVLHEGRNRQIRRLLDAFDLPVLRLIRVAIGALALGDLAKGAWRPLGDNDLRALDDSSGAAAPP